MRCCIIPIAAAQANLADRRDISVLTFAKEFIERLSRNFPAAYTLRLLQDPALFQSGLDACEGGVQA